jgi:ATP-dependent Zn protease
MVGADIANVVNEAALLAARKNKKSVEMKDFGDCRNIKRGRTPGGSMQDLIRLIRNQYFR